jgi:hypothetical protein
MATTTNYGWETPDDTDLVKDGAAAIRTLGSSVDTTTKALNPSTTLGDVEYRSSTANTNTRLGIGSTGQVLTVTGGVPVWATPAGATPNYTLINTGGTTLSGAGTVTISGISGKNDLYIFIAGVTGGDGNNYSDLIFRINTDTGSNYEYVAGALLSTNTSGGALSVVNQQSASATSIVLGGHKTPATFGITIQGANAAGVKPVQFVGSGLIANDYNLRVSGQGAYKGTSTISSVSIISTNGDLDSGTIYVYGA